jgi:rhamnose transport system ATP-binding protein
MLAKWLETKPRVLIFDEPTRGIDVGAKAEVHAIIRQLASEGVAILVISSDLPEVLALADRVLVMREGRQAGILPSKRRRRNASSPGRRARKDPPHDARMTGPNIPAGGIPSGFVRSFTHRKPRQKPRRRLLTRRCAWWRWPLPLLATVLFFATQIEGYLAPRMFNRISTSAAVVLPLAVGQAIVVMTRNIDLSVGSILGVTAYVVGDSWAACPTCTRSSQSSSAWRSARCWGR